jgi:hypothetical protein
MNRHQYYCQGLAAILVSLAFVATNGDAQTPGERVQLESAGQQGIQETASRLGLQSIAADRPTIILGPGVVATFQLYEGTIASININCIPPNPWRVGEAPPTGTRTIEAPFLTSSEIEHLISLVSAFRDVGEAMPERAVPPIDYEAPVPFRIRYLAYSKALIAIQELNPNEILATAPSANIRTVGVAYMGTLTRRVVAKRKTLTIAYTDQGKSRSEQFVIEVGDPRSKYYTLESDFDSVEVGDTVEIDQVVGRAWIRSVTHKPTSPN